MLFNSYQFLLYFPVVCILYFVLPRKLKNPWLLLCSYFFYGLWNPAYLGLILCSTLTTYLCSLALHALEERGGDHAVRNRKWIVAINLIFNLGILFVFKYYHLFAVTASRLGVQMPELNVLLPVGISFYTFQSLGYTLDVYRGDVKAERNLMIYALFVSFFPQLVAGPIERTANLLPQFRQEHRFSYDAMRRGLLLMMWGFFMKLVIADRAALVVNHLYNGEPTTGFLYLVATILFSFQIYGDFAGYSMIAIGAAEIMGFSLMRNFRQPYLSQSVSEFWRRWHISLSNWFRDYVYFPMGGSRVGTARVLFNLIVVFLLSGLWHGAAYTFILWGFLNGVYQAIERLTLSRDRHRVHTGVHKMLRILLTYVLITLAWVPFRAQSIGQAFFVFGRIFSSSIIPTKAALIGQTLATYGLGKWEMVALAVGILILLLVDLLEDRRPGIAQRLETKPAWQRWPIYYALLFTILIFGVYGSASGVSTFLYFQF